MRVVVFGASGGIGRELVQQGLAAGHQVTAVVRGSSSATFDAHPDLSVATADVMDPDAIEPVLLGHDAVLSAVGSRDGREPTTICHDSASSILWAMEAAGVKRLEAVSGSGPYTDGNGLVMRRLAKPLGRRFLHHVFDDMVAMDEALAQSSVEWTSVRPPRLTDKPLTGHYRTSRDRDFRWGVTVSRADVAHFMLQILDDPATYRSAWFVAN